MKFRFLIFFFLIFGQIQAQLRLNKADSLHFCGYFTEEIAERQIKSKSDISNQILLENAKIMILVHSQAFDAASKALSELEKKYETIPKTTQVQFYLNFTKAKILREQEKYDEAIRLITVSKPINSIFEGFKFYELAYTLSYKKKHFEAIQYYKKAIHIFEKQQMATHHITATAYNNIGFAYDQLNMVSYVLKNYEKALNIWSKFYQSDVDILSTSYNNIIYEYIDYGDKFNALRMQKRFEEMMANYLKNPQIFTPKSNLAHFHAQIMFHLSSVRFYGFFENSKKIEEHVLNQNIVFEQCPKQFRKDNLGVLLATYEAAAYAERVMKNEEKVIKYNKFVEKTGNSEYYTMKTQAMYAMLYYYKQAYTTSLVFTEKSLNAMASYKGTSLYTVSILKAELQANLGKIKEAKQTIAETYAMMLNKKKAINEMRLADFGEVVSAYHINILIHSGMAYRQIYLRDGKKKADLKMMKNFYRVAAEMFEKYYQKGIFNPTLDQYLRNIKEGLLFSDVRQAHDKNEIFASLNLIERISSQHLWQRFILRNEENLRLPKNLLLRKNELQLKINSLENSEETNEKLELEKAKKELQGVENEIFKKNPDFKRFSESNFDIKELQTKLSADKVIIKYSLTDSTVFAHLISKNDIKIFDLGNKNLVEKTVLNYYQKLTKIDFSFGLQSKQLFDYLIKPLAPTSKKIDFITEDFLSYLPFETLMNQSGKLLVNETDVAYVYSLKLWGVTTLKSGSYSLNLTGFAPEYNENIQVSRDASNRLLYTASELEKIATNFNKSNIFKSNTATKHNFLSSIGQSKIHHLAMHSLLNENDYEQSSLLFQNNEKLYFKELYALNFPSEMVVLSACNTGVGQFQNGEGLMSISRALNYAGVKSLVHSLWQVPDKETSELMTYFYEFLAQKHDKDAALALAKRKFIEQNPAKSHPYYWAGFVLNGNTDPIEDSQSQWLFLLVFLLLLAVFWGYKKYEFTAPKMV